ncbi:CAP domain-containing protein [Candidatus Parcubacteria bacterium]|nr:CAP domain-containing protein [Candidatus Parcubacteria bacterium]
MHRTLRTLARFFIPSKGNRYKPRFFTARPVGLILAVLVLLELGVLAQGMLLTRSDRYLTSVLPGALAAFSNEARSEAALPALRPDAHLAKAALLKAEDMASRGYFSHQTPEGQEPWIFLEKAGYDYSYAGENLAVNFSDSQDVTDAWLLSPTHRANLLNADFSEVGFGVATGTYQGREAVFVVQFLAAPAGADVPVQPAMEVLPAEVSVGESGVSEVKAYVTSQSSLSGRILSSPRSLASTVNLILLAFIACLFALAMVLKLRAQQREAWSNGLLAISALAGLILLQGGLFPGEVFLPESAASVSLSVPR